MFHIRNVAIIPQILECPENVAVGGRECSRRDTLDEEKIVTSLRIEHTHLSPSAHSDDETKIYWFCHICDFW